ncbi:MAG: hypothetical protein WCT05_01830 [Lentisphaeria bacterium]
MKDKLAHPDLTLAVTFDEFTTRADLAKGERDSIAMRDVNFMLRGAVGFDTRQAYQPEPGESLTYRADQNADFQQGTITMWAKAVDYIPGKAEKRGNVGYAQLRFEEKNRFVQFLLYEYDGILYWDWYSSETPHRYQDVGRVRASLEKIRTGEWFQIAATWDKELVIYLNGQVVNRGQLPDKAAKTLDLMPLQEKSFVGIKNLFYGDEHKQITQTDDFKLYSRALTPIEVANQYNRLLVDPGENVITDFGVVLNGVDRGRGRGSDQLEAEFDFISLPPEKRTLYESGKFELDWVLTLPDQSTRRGKWRFAADETVKFIPEITEPGRYKLTCDTTSAEIVRPDLSFIGSGWGDEDTVPEIWRDFMVKDRKVTLWNRVYHFGEGPLPEQIEIKGKPLFSEAPALLIDGQVVSGWQIENTIKNNSSVIFNGRAKIAGGWVVYATEIEFDGMIKFDWNIEGMPGIRLMQLAWKQNPDYSDFLMRPHVWNGSGKGEFLYHNGMDDSLRMIWLVSERGGFAFASENDANWIYDETKPVYHVDTKTGSATIDLITRQVRMPEATPYRAVFIATPTRPFPKVFRAVRHNDGTYPGFRMTTFGGKAFTGVSTYRPNWRFGYEFKSTSPDTHGIYGMANAMSSESPEPVYFAKYWNIPGAGGYTFRFTEYLPDGNIRGSGEHSIPACNAGCVNDFYSRNIHELLTHPQGAAVAAVYFDLCGNGVCANPLHGCGYQDKFGREIKTFALLHKRELLKRTVRQAHAAGKQVWIHAQRDFFPMMNGLGDFFFPGEQFEALLARTLYPFTDEIPELIFKSEFNRNIIGTGVICWTAVTSLQRAQLPIKEKKRGTEAMESMLLLYDIDANTVFAYQPVLATIWNVQRRYRVENPDTQFFRFDRQKEIVSTDNRLRSSYYVSPEGYVLAAVCNTEPVKVSARIQLGKFAQGLVSVREEYLGSTIPVIDGSFALSVPSRSFRLIGIRKPLPEGWKLDYLASVYNPDRASSSDYVFDQENGTHKLEKKDDKGFVLTAFIPVRSGFKYGLSFEVRQTNGTAAKWSLQPQFNGESSGLKTKIGKIPSGSEWQKFTTDFLVPEETAGSRCFSLLLTLGAEGVGSETEFRCVEVTEVENR